MAKSTRGSGYLHDEHSSPQSSQEAAHPISEHEKNKVLRAELPACPLPSSSAPTANGYVTPSSQGSSDLDDAFVNLSLEDAEPPSNRSLDQLLSPDVVEVFALHQAISQTAINPQHDVNRLRALGSQRYKLHLVVEMEGARGLSLGNGLTLDIRVERIRKRCPLRECPRSKQPNTDTSNSSSIRTLVCELQRYESLKTEYVDWPREEFDGFALIFVSRGFGGLHYKLPAHGNLNELLDLLIWVSEGKRKQHGVGGFTPTVSFNLRAPGVIQVCGLYYGLKNLQDPLPKVCWDLEFITDHGAESYSDLLLAHARQATGKEPKLDSLCKEAPELHLALEGLIELKDYPELEETVRPLQVPNKLTTSDIVTALQFFPEARTDFKDWPREQFGDALMIYTTKCLANQGFYASTEAILEDPTRVLATIFWQLAMKRFGCAPEPSLSGLLARCRLARAAAELSIQDGVSQHENLPRTPPSSESSTDIEGPHLLGSHDSESLADETWSDPDDEGSEDDDSISNGCADIEGKGHPGSDLIPVDLGEKREGTLRHVGNEHCPMLLRVCGLLFHALQRTEEGKARGCACIECVWSSLVTRYPQYRLEWALAETELLLSLPPLPTDGILERVQRCEGILKPKDFSLLQPRLGREQWFESVDTVIALLQCFSRFRLEEKAFAFLAHNPQAQCLYATACLAELNFGLPKDLSSRLLESFNKILWEARRKEDQEAGKRSGGCEWLEPPGCSPIV